MKEQNDNLELIDQINQLKSENIGLRKQVNNLRNDIVNLSNIIEIIPQKYKSILSNISGIILILDDNFKIKRANISAIELLKFKNSNIIGRDFHQFVDPFYQDIFHKFCIELLDSSEIKECRVILKNKLNQLIDTSIIGVNLDSLGDNSIYFILNITENSSKFLSAFNFEDSHNIRDFLDSLSIGVYKSNKLGKIIFANKAFIETLGYSNFEEMERDFLENEYYFNTITRMLFREKIRINPDSEINGFEYEFTRRDGKKIYIRESGRAIFDSNGDILHYEGSVEDITQIKVAENVLQSQQKFISSLIESLPNYVYVYDVSSGKIIFTNSRCNDLLGFTQEELTSMSSEQTMNLIHPDDRQMVNDAFSSISQVDTYQLFQYDYRIQKKSGEYIWVNENATPLLKSKNGKVVEIIGSMTDVSRIKQTELKLEETIMQKDKFFSIIAHDMRVPFMGFIGLSEVLSKDYINLSLEEVVEISSSMYESAVRIQRLLENLLEWSRVQKKDYVLNFSKLKLKKEVIASIESLEQNAVIKNIEIINSVNEEVEVFADSYFLQTIIRNIVSNAIKFTDNSGKIKIFSNENNNFIELIIKDNGVGIDKDMLKSLFDLTIKTSTLGTKNEQGSGLGLILCKDLALKCGGDLVVESELNKGTSVIISLRKVEF